MQILWGDTRYIGCSYDTCSGSLFIVCQFYFGATIADDSLPYTFGPVASECPVDRDISILPLCTGCPADNWELCTVCNILSIFKSV